MALLGYDSNGELLLNGAPVKNWAVDGPSYLYSMPHVRERIGIYRDGLQSCFNNTSIHYAMKANHHPQMLDLFKQAGVGVDVVSGGEFRRALQAGFKPQQIVFSGVAKTESEISHALQNEVLQLNVESVSELKRIATIATSLSKKVSVCLRINPNVNAETHPYISTGFKENKFGIAEAQIGECLEVIRAQQNLCLIGLSIHIGSQLLDFSAFGEALQKAKQIYLNLQAQGFALERLDVGGGVGIFYDKDEGEDHKIFASYLSVLKAELAQFPATIQFEPGRYLIARAGILLTQVQYVKKTPEKTFVIVDTGMHHLLRPMLYQAHHRIWPIKKRQGEMITVDIVGPVCESSDTLGKNRKLSPVEEGDWLAILDVGAYGAVMSSGYNSFGAVKEIFI